MIQMPGVRPQPIMLSFLPIIAFEQCSKKVTDYTHYYAHHYCNYATVYIQFYESI